MDKHLIAAVNEVLSKKTEKSTYGKCFCEATPSSNIAVKYHNEATSRCAAWNLTNRNISIILPIISDFFDDNIPFSSGMLRALIKFLITSPGTEGKTKIIATIERHLMVHPSCADHASCIYEDLLLKQHEDFDGTTLLDYVLTSLEAQILKGRACVVQSRLSRSDRRKKVDSAYAYDKPESKRAKRIVQCVEPEPSESTDDDLALKFASLKIIAVILKHDFYSKLNRSKSEKGNFIEQTFIGRIFLDFDDTISLKDELTERIIEIYRNSDPSHQQIVNNILELVANLCLFLDSGKLTVDANILEAKAYPICQQFCQYFCQRVFRRNTAEEALVIVKSLRPDWLRLNAVFYLFRQKWKPNIPTGLKSIFLYVDNALQRIHQTELSNVLKTLNVGTQSRSSNEISELQDKLMSACRSDDVAILRKLSKTGDIDFHLTDQAGCNVLHIVSKHGSLQCAKFLLEFHRKNIDVDVKDAKGVTPLAYALQYNNNDVYRLLLEYGATPLQPSDEKFEISSQSFDAVFKKKLNEETSMIIFYLYKLFTSTYHLREIQNAYEQCKLEGRTADPVQKRNYEYFVQELKTYSDLKKLTSRITQIKNLPSYVDILKTV